MTVEEGLCSRSVTTDSENMRLKLQEILRKLNSLDSRLVALEGMSRVQGRNQVSINVEEGEREENARAMSMMFDLNDLPWPIEQLKGLKEGESFLEYIDAFVSLVSKVKLSDEDQVVTFIKGLKSDNQKLIAILSPKNLEQAISFAKILFTESDFDRKRKKEEIEEEEVVEAEQEGSMVSLHTLHGVPTNQTTFTLPGLSFYEPNLWWSNGEGRQLLCRVPDSVEVRGDRESGILHHLFGFREIENHVDNTTGKRLFKVKGQPILIQGSNWILLYGLSKPPEKRYATDIQFQADMKLYMIPCWKDGLAMKPQIYHHYDIYGFPVWYELWITGDVDRCGIQVSDSDGSLNQNLSLTCAKDTIKLLRNHASLALGGDGNEQVPPPDINAALKVYLMVYSQFRKEDVIDIITGNREEDPCIYLNGTQIYFSGSMGNIFANDKGVFSDGPCMLVAATIRATMTKEGCTIPIFRKLLNGYIEEVLDPISAYHKYISYSNSGQVYNQILPYGIMKDLNDFYLKVQLVNYIRHGALIEGWSGFDKDKDKGLNILRNGEPSKQRLDRAILIFFQHFKKTYVGNQTAQSPKSNDRMFEWLGVLDPLLLLKVIVGKIASNLKCYAGSVIQYALPIPLGLDSVSAATGVGNGHNSTADCDERLVVEAIRKWNICQKQNRRDRKDALNIYGEDGTTDNQKIYYERMTMGYNNLQGTAQTGTKFGTNHENKHPLYISEVGLHMHQAKLPLWAKSGIYFQSMLANDVYKLDNEASFGGKIEIERISTCRVEARSKNLVHAFDYLQAKQEIGGNVALRYFGIVDEIIKMIRHEGRAGFYKGRSTKGFMSLESTPDSLFRIDVIKYALIDIMKDLGETAMAPNNQKTYGLLFDWLYPSHLQLMLRGITQGTDIPEFTTPLLEFMVLSIPLADIWAQRKGTHLSADVPIQWKDKQPTKAIWEILHDLRRKFLHAPLRTRVLSRGGT